MKKLRYIRLAVIMVVLSTIMTGCQYSKYKLPEESVVGEYAQVKAEPIDSTLLGNLKWEEVFTEPLLQAYISQALENNKDLQNAKLNVDVANAQLLGAKLSYVPSLAIGASGAGSKFYVDNSSFNWTYNIPASASWEVDIFGKLLNSKRQAKQVLLQSEAYRQAVRSQIIGAVANTYYALVTLHKQHAIYLETADNWKKSVEMMEQMKEAGRYNEVAVVQSRANYNSVLAAIPGIEEKIHEANNSMSLLLNEPMKTWIVNGDAEPLTIESAIGTGIEMKYVANRPDVAAAEHSFAAAHYATNRARANFYPSITLSAQGGFTDLVGSVIMNPGKWFVNLAGQLVAPLFSRGKNIANLKVAKARQQQSLNTFEFTVLNACAEVSNAIVTMNTRVQQQFYFERQVENLAKAVEYNEDLQQLATATYLEVISAQQQLLGAQQNMLNNELATSRASINLYQSLGGGR